MDNDYIKTLSYDEKLIFIKVLCCLIRADGVVDASELEFLKAIAIHFDIDINLIVDIAKSAANIDYVREAAHITNRRHALELIKELCVLANVDEKLDDAELDVIINTAEAMGIEEDKIVLINRWVLDSLVLNKAGRIIMEADNG
ncbi:MAG: hypothetical protein Q4D80_02175 [Pseudomonadota bacterium]|nr:hypothetical protein [Pseudomonadota bacterium]